MTVQLIRLSEVGNIFASFGKVIPKYYIVTPSPPKHLNTWSPLLTKWKKDMVLRWFRYFRQYIPNPEEFSEIRTPGVWFRFLMNVVASWYTLAFGVIRSWRTLRVTGKWPCSATSEALTSRPASACTSSGQAISPWRRWLPWRIRVLCPARKRPPIGDWLIDGLVGWLVGW